MRIFDNEFSSSEQAYQCRYFKYIGMDELAQEVLEAPSAEEAKDIASRAPGKTKQLEFYQGMCNAGNSSCQSRFL